LAATAGNPCVGVVVFLVLPAIFFTGLALVPIGVYLSKWADEKIQFPPKPPKISG
jgi:hypothetical protein